MAYRFSATMSTALVIIGGRTMIPLRFVAENLGCLVGWDEPTKGVTVMCGGQNNEWAATWTTAVHLLT